MKPDCGIVVANIEPAVVEALRQRPAVCDAAMKEQAGRAQARALGLERRSDPAGARDPRHHRRLEGRPTIGLKIDLVTVIATSNHGHRQRCAQMDDRGGRIGASGSAFSGRIPRCARSADRRMCRAKVRRRVLACGLAGAAPAAIEAAPVELLRPYATSLPFRLWLSISIKLSVRACTWRPRALS